MWKDLFAESFACGVYHQIIHAQAPYCVDGIAIFEENIVDTMRTASTGCTGCFRFVSNVYLLVSSLSE